MKDKLIAVLIIIGITLGAVYLIWYVLEFFRILPGLIQTLAPTAIIVLVLLGLERLLRKNSD